MNVFANDVVAAQTVEIGIMQKLHTRRPSRGGAIKPFSSNATLDATEARWGLS